MTTRTANAQRLTALYQQIGGEWVDVRVEWHPGGDGITRGFVAYNLPLPYRSPRTIKLWLGTTHARAVIRVRAHRRRALRAERVEVADRVAGVIESVSEAVKAVGD